MDYGESILHLDLYFTMDLRKLQVSLGDELNQELPFSLRKAFMSHLVENVTITATIKKPYNTPSSGKCD